MTKVYVLNRGAHDYSDAERFGELVFCTEGSLDKLDVQQMYRELEPILAYATEEDYIILTSLSSLCAVACSIFTNIFGRLNLLIYTNNGYVARELYF
jgi:hypothetical protein